jgi:hypothetical protein
LLKCREKSELNENWEKFGHFKSVLKYVYVSIMKPTWCTFHSFYWESRASTCFDYYLLILRRCYTNGIWCHDCGFTAIVAQPTDNKRTQYTKRHLACAGPPEDKQVMLETYTSPWFSIHSMKSTSRCFHYTGILWCTVSKTFSLCCWQWKKAFRNTKENFRNVSMASLEILQFQTEPHVAQNSKLVYYNICMAKIIRRMPRYITLYVQYPSCCL